jgi:hypothetical protein
VLFFSHGDRQCFIAPTIVHQAADLTGDLLIGLPGNWVSHAPPSGYMDLDGWYKTISNFSKLSGASPGNPQFLFFDGHDSHWDADSLDLIAARHIEAFFLKAGDSKNNQPNDNGPNACLKGYYNEVKALWDVRWATTAYTPAFMNHVVADTWVLYKLRAASIIIGAFTAKTRIYPLRAPSEDRQYAVGACSAALQCAERKKATEVNIVAREALGTIAYKSVLTNPNSTVIFRAQQDSSRKLLIWSEAFDVINCTLIVPVQEMKRVVQELNAAKGIKLGASSIPTESRQNPDSSYGVYCNDELRARARRSHDKRQGKEKNDGCSFKACNT